jgi:hypothetical protein
MRDEETGSWWQQVSGEAILGPLKGRRLNPVFSDELSFAAWRREHPQGRVLRPDERVAQRYVAADWEERVAKLPVVTPAGPEEPLPPRALIVGISLNGAATAYPFAVLRRQSPVLDRLGGVPLFVVVGEDQKSVRAFERSVEGRTLEFFVKPGASPLKLVDGETGTEWDFTGRAVSGPLAGRQLRRVAVLSDYWFDWKTYHPETTVYRLGERDREYLRRK